MDVCVCVCVCVCVYKILHTQKQSQIFLLQFQVLQYRKLGPKAENCAW